MFPCLLGALGPAYNEFSYSSYRIVIIIIIIKMHSSRMRTVRCSGRRGGVSAQWGGVYPIMHWAGGVSDQVGVCPVHAGIHPPREQNDRRL